MQPNSEFLTPDECIEVDKALLTSKDKFSARIAIYALRSLKQIAQKSGQAIADLHPTQIEDWIYQDKSLQGGIDNEFKKFFSQLVIASINPLTQIAQANQTNIESLTISQVVSWFEVKAKEALKSQR
ncbi:hypothetical protein [Leptolyngbya sp. NIES-2104]|uniref:hypothetical protein n=1 Tax=Leptolyngbya sp. NIES-2104 TaxID=1552121 RepID=UPI0006EC99A4|nr:hypothetical protein [Leptolyngbya sp. NIES-2104]GAP93531.1 hypothetical protein NIES2104_00370 [Leptolyngbya sp. NIES-2104]